MIKTYQQAIDFIHGREIWKKTPTFNRMDELLLRLKNPQKKIKGIHVTGTNGKGSTTAYLRDILIKSGLTVGTYTSPFIIKFNDRISVNGNMISDDELLDLVQQIEPIVCQMDQKNSDGLTEFEIITAMMFLYFAQNPVDIVIVEVGIGGLFDSTNVFTPILSIITSVGFDHTHVLGNTLTAIAQQKSAIIKPNVPVIYGGKKDDEAGSVVLATAHQLNTLALTFDDLKIDILKNDDMYHEKFDFYLKSNIFGNKEFNIKNITLGMLGKYQIENASIAILAYCYLITKNVIKFNPDLVRDSLLSTSWPARFEVIKNNPNIIIDGAHNVPAIDGLVELLTRKFYKVNKITIIFSALADKDFIKMAQKLIDVKNVKLIATEFSGPTKRKIVNEETLAKELKTEIKTSSNWKKALDEALIDSKNNDIILLTGSLYFVSEVRNHFN